MSDNSSILARLPAPPEGASKPRLHAVAATQIAALVSADALQPGDRLPGEHELSRRLSVSRATIREALVALEVSGVIHIRPNTGAFLLQSPGDAPSGGFGDLLRARANSAGELKEVTRLRILVECDGARVSIEQGGVEWESALVAAHHKLAHVEKRMQRDSIDQFELWRQCDWQFHDALLAACGSALHRELHKVLFERFQQIVKLEFQDRGFRGDAIVEEHHAILEAALARDGDRCAAALTRHLGVYFSQQSTGAENRR